MDKTCPEKLYKSVHLHGSNEGFQTIIKAGSGNPKKINEPTHKLYTNQGSKCSEAVKMNCFDKTNIILVTYPETTEEHRRANVCDEVDILTACILTVLCMCGRVGYMAVKACLAVQ